MRRVFSNLQLLQVATNKFKFRNISVENYKIYFLSKPNLPWANNSITLSTKRYIFSVSLLHINTECHWSLDEGDWPIAFFVCFVCLHITASLSDQDGLKLIGRKNVQLVFLNHKHSPKTLQFLKLKPVFGLEYYLLYVCTKLFSKESKRFKAVRNHWQQCNKKE